MSVDKNTNNDGFSYLIYFLGKVVEELKRISKSQYTDKKEKEEAIIQLKLISQLYYALKSYNEVMRVRARAQISESNGSYITQRDKEEKIEYILNEVFDKKLEKLIKGQDEMKIGLKILKEQTKKPTYYEKIKDVVTEYTIQVILTLIFILILIWAGYHWIIPYI